MKNILKTQKQVEDEVHSKWPHIDIISNYIGANDSVTFRCNKCNYTWSTTVRSVVFSKCGCPSCGVAEAKKLRAEEHCKELIDYSKFEYLGYAGVQNGVHMFRIKCKICGAERITNSNNIKRFGCKNCKMKEESKRRSKGTEKFIEEAKRIHGDRYDYSKVEYKNGKIKVCIICPEHGEFWQTPLKHIYRQQGCPTCTGSGLEKITNTVLLDSGLTFEKEYFIKYKNRKFFIDFVITYNNKKYFIELNGEQHYKNIPGFGNFTEQKERDILLQEYCNSNNIPLFWVRFDEIVSDSIKEIIKQITAVNNSNIIDNNRANSVNPEMGIPS